MATAKKTTGSKTDNLPEDDIIDSPPPEENTENTENKENGHVDSSDNVSEENATDEVASPSSPRYPVQEGLRGRDGGPYLDDVDRARLEEYRATRENREPDYSRVKDHEDMVPPHLLIDNLNSNPGSRGVDPLERFELVPKQN